MTACIGLTAKGNLCQGIAAYGSDYCPAHDPARKDARYRAASKAARSKKGGSKEISNLKAELEALAEDVLACEVEPKVAAVATQIYNARIKLIEVERRMREADDIERRIAEIQEALDRTGDSGYGA
jgi:hypothetical protein